MVMGKLTKYWLPVLTWATVIFAFSSLEVHPASEIYWQDFIVKKTAHLVEYAVLFTLTYRALLNTALLNRKKAAIISLAVVLVYGLTDEYHQSFTPGREPKVRDVVIDGGGGALAWLGIWKYLPKAPARLRNLAKSLQIT